MIILKTFGIIIVILWLYITLYFIKNVWDTSKIFFTIHGITMVIVTMLIIISIIIY